ncbi:MAG: tetratricopeptide repeat protein [Bacteroidota bacterium]
MKKGWILLGLLVGMCLHMSAQGFQTGSRNTEAQAAYKAGNQALKAQSFVEAEAAFSQAISYDERFVDAYIALGMTKRILGQNGSAEFALIKAVELYPRSLQAHEELALLYLSQDKDDQAINQYKVLLSHHPGYPEAFLSIAQIYFDQSKFSEALQASEAAIRILIARGNPKRTADARLLAGRCYLKLGIPKTAIKYFKANKKQMGQQGVYYYYLGLAYFKDGNKTKANDNLLEAQNRGYTIPEYLLQQLNGWGENGD